MANDSRLDASDCRDFVVRAAIAGLSMGLHVDSLRVTGTSAQDAIPAGGAERTAASDHFALVEAGDRAASRLRPLRRRSG